MIQSKLRNQSDITQTEEATKQRYVLPLLAALGYDPYSSDVEPEYTLDFGIKRGEKVDYALQVNNQPVAIVECKQLGTSLNKDNVQQLFRYFQVCGVHIAILTNGNDYWFFTDSTKQNIMDSEPYFKINLQQASETEIDKLSQYSKDNIQNLSIAELIQKEAFIKEQKLLMQGLKSNNIPAWLIQALWSRTKETDEKFVESIQIDKSTLAGLVFDEVRRVFNVQKPKQSLVEDDILYDFDINLDNADNKLNNKKLQQSEKRKINKENRQNIRLHHEYIYNDYSDGNWQFHQLDYAIIYGRKLVKPQFSQIFYYLQDYLIRCGYSDKLIEASKGQLQRQESERHFKELGCSGVFICTKYSTSDIIKIIESLMRACGQSDNNILLQFYD